MTQLRSSAHCRWPASLAVAMAVVDLEEGQYLGHPTTVLLEDGRALLCVYPKGRGNGGIVLKKSMDGGVTYGHWEPKQSPYVVSVRLKLAELDTRAAAASGAPGDLRP